jgi:hypothetical protein
MLKKFIFIIIILSSLKFYQPAFFPEILLKASDWLGIFLIFGLLIIYLIYNREKQEKKHFVFPVILILVSVFISMFGAYVFQDQSFLATGYGQRAIYFYFIYFLLHYLKFSVEYIVRIIGIFGLVFIAIYIIQYVVFPIQITQSHMFLDRGTLRIFLSGAGYLVIAYFIWLYSIFKSFKIKYLIFLLLALTVFVLLGTRQVIAAMVLLTILAILQSRIIKSKFLLFTLIGIAFIPVYFLFQDIIFAMFEVTLEQSESVQGNIRVVAARFFLTDFFPSGFSYFTGNGATGPSLYGLRVVRYMEEYGYYQSDLGLIGEYTMFGALFVIAVFIILIRVLRTKLPDKLMFIKYNFLGIILTLVTGGGAFGSSGANILIICILLYVVDVYLNNKESVT